MAQQFNLNSLTTGQNMPVSLQNNVQDFSQNPLVKVPGASGAFWKGQDGNVYVKGAQGTNSAGKYDPNTSNYWTGQGYKQITDPLTGVLGDKTDTNNVPFTPPSNTTGSQPAYDPSINQYYDQQISGIQGQQGRLDNQLNIGTDNINKAYNDAFGKLTGQNQATKDTSLRNFVQTKNDISQGVGQQANSLKRLLGSRGFGNSAFAQQAAPYLVAQQGAQQANQVDQTYGQNNQLIEQDFGNNTDALRRQKESSLGGLQSQIASTRQNLLQQLGSLQSQKVGAKPGSTYAQAIAASRPYVDQANSLSGTIDGLGKAPDFNTNYAAPALKQYNYAPAQAATIGNANPATANANPYLAALLNPQDKQKSSGLIPQV